MPKQLKIHPEKCSGCRSCELMCAIVNANDLNPSMSRISVIEFIEGQYPLPYNFPSTCKQCADAPCMKVCPVGAISRSKDITKAVVIDHALCNNCRICVKACPFGAMLYDRPKERPFKCELCGGEPACAAICPTGAIVFINQKYFYSKSLDLQMQAFTILSQMNQKNMGKIPKNQAEGISKPI